MSHSFELIPALDMLAGQVVRLRKGDYDDVTVYDDDPVSMAKKLEAAGASRLHVVDLDGARSGTAENAPIIEAMVAQTSLRLQVGGGIRDRQRAEHWLACGVERVVLGTAAVRAPEMTRALSLQHPGAVVVALDARGDEVAVEGWREGSGASLRSLSREVDGWKPAAILYTNIERDGMGAGPDVEGSAALQKELTTTVIASGGIGTLDHIRELRAAGVRAAVCGKALYAGAFTLDEAFQAARNG